MKAKWWTPDTIFVSSLGVLLVLILFVSLFARSASRDGSDLIPAAVLEDIRDQESRCRTRTWATIGPRC